MAYQLPVGEGSVAMFQVLSVALPIATGIGDATKQTTAINAAAAAEVRNRIFGGFLKVCP